MRQDAPPRAPSRAPNLPPQSIPAPPPPAKNNCTSSVVLHLPSLHPGASLFLLLLLLRTTPFAKVCKSGVDTDCTSGADTELSFLPRKGVLLPLLLHLLLFRPQVRMRLSGSPIPPNSWALGGLTGEQVLEKMSVPVQLEDREALIKAANTCAPPAPLPCPLSHVASLGIYIRRSIRDVGCRFPWNRRQLAWLCELEGYKILNKKIAGQLEVSKISIKTNCRSVGGVEDFE